MKALITALTTTAILTASQTVLATDIDQGKSLHQESCTSCHDDGVYTREGRQVNSMDALSAQVQRCETNLNLTWFPAEVDAVTEYLNTSYYNFK